MRTDRRIAVSLATIALVGACRFDSPGYDGTRYACAADQTCPAGFVCVDGWCTDDPVDASLEGADATPLLATDAAPEPGVLTRRFGVEFDTTLYASSPTSNDGANQALSIDADPLATTVMYFDLSSIPPDAIVLAASIDAYAFDPIETGAFEIYPLVESWNEGQATFVERKTGLVWAGPGAAAPSRDAALLAELEARDIGLITFTLDVAGVQAWVSASEQNVGIVLVSSSPDGRGGQLRSGEYTVVAERPYLDVTYRLP